jgi:hypothetical protein
MNTKTYWIFLFLTLPTVSTVNPKSLRLTDPVILWYLPYYCCVSFFGTKGGPRYVSLLTRVFSTLGRQ